MHAFISGQRCASTVWYLDYSAESSLHGQRAGVEPDGRRGGGDCGVGRLRVDRSRTRNAGNGVPLLLVLKDISAPLTRNAMKTHGDPPRLLVNVQDLLLCRSVEAVHSARGTNQRPPIN